MNPLIKQLGTYAAYHRDPRNEAGAAFEERPGGGPSWPTGRPWPASRSLPMC
jgi:hypothetical protein